MNPNIILNNKLSLFKNINLQNSNITSATANNIHIDVDVLSQKGRDKFRTLADFLYNDDLDPLAEQELVLRVRKEWEDSFQTDRMRFPAGDQQQNFYDFATLLGFADLVTKKHAYYLLNQILEHIEKHYCNPNEKNPAIALFVYNYSLSLQLYDQLGDDEIFLIWSYLNKLEWISNSYYQDPLLHAIVQSILVVKYPFSIVSSTLLLSALQLAASKLIKLDELSIFDFKRRIHLSIQGHISHAAEVLAEYFDLNKDVAGEKLEKLHFFMRQLLQDEMTTFAPLTGKEMNCLGKMLYKMLSHSSQDICSLGICFALIFKDGRYDSLCCDQLNRLLKEPNLSVLNALYLNLNRNNYKVIFDSTSSFDWICLLLRLHGKNKKRFNLAIYLLCRYDEEVINQICNALLNDYNGKIRLWDLLMILLSCFEKNKEDVNRLIYCLCKFFSMGSSKFRYANPYPLKIQALILHVFSIPKLLEQVDPNTQVAWISPENVKVYREALIAYIICQDDLKPIDKQFILFKSIVKSHLSFSTIPANYLNHVLELLKPYLQANDQIGDKDEAHLWDIFRNQCYVCLTNNFETLPIPQATTYEDEDHTGLTVEINNSMSEKFSLSSLLNNNNNNEFGVEQREHSQTPEDSLYQFGIDKFVSDGKWIGPTNVVPLLGEPQIRRLKAFFYSRHHIGSRNNPTKKNIDEWYRELKIENFEINGGGAQWILGEEFYREFLVRLGVPENLIRDALFHRMRQLPNDFDTPIPAIHQQQGTIALIEPIFQSLNQQFNRPHDSMYAWALSKKYWPAPLGHPIQIAVVAFDFFESKKKCTQGKGEFRLEQIHRASVLPRHHLNICDALSLVVKMKEKSICCSIQSDYHQIELVLWHHICRRLEADDPKTVDQRGVVTELALITRGSSPVDQGFIPNLFSNYDWNASYFANQLRKAVENHCVGGEDAFFAALLNSALFLSENFLVEVFQDIKFDQMNKGSFLMSLFEISRKVQEDKIAFVQNVLTLWGYLGWDSTVLVFERNLSKQIEFRCYYEHDFISILVKDNLTQALIYLVNNNEWNSLQTFLRKWLDIGSLKGLPLKSILWSDIDFLYTQRNVIAKKIALMLYLKLYEQEPLKRNKKQLGFYIQEMEGFWSIEEWLQIKYIIYNSFPNDFSNYDFKKLHNYTKASPKQIKKKIFVLATMLTKLSSDEKYTSHVKAFSEMLNSLFQPDVFNFNERYDLSRHIGKIINILLKLEEHDTIYELLKQVSIKNISLWLKPACIQEIVDSQLQRIPLNLNTLLERKIVYEFVKNKLLYEMKIEQTRKDVPIFVQAFLHSREYSHAIEVARCAVEYHPILKELVQTLLSQSLLTEAEYFLTSNVMVLYQSHVIEELWGFINGEVPLGNALRMFVEKIELLKSKLTIMQLFLAIRRFLTIQKTYYFQIVENWVNISKLLIAVNLSPCDEWTIVIDGLAKCRGEGPKEAVRFYNMIYRSV